MKRGGILCCLQVDPFDHESEGKSPFFMGAMVTLVATMLEAPFPL